jgi:uncharacterized membrane protein
MLDHRYGIYNLREVTMRQFTISAAAMMTFATLLASAPADAIENHGPKQVGNQCFTVAQGQGRDLIFGSWSTCPQTASVAAAPAHRQARHR